MKCPHCNFVMAPLMGLIPRTMCPRCLKPVDIKEDALSNPVQSNPVDIRPKCRVCEGGMNIEDSKTKSDGEFHLNTVQRVFTEEGISEGEGPKGFRIQTDIFCCRRCFWRIVQKMADSELVAMMEPGDFKRTM